MLALAALRLIPWPGPSSGPQVPCGQVGQAYPCLSQVKAQGGRGQRPLAGTLAVDLGVGRSGGGFTCLIRSRRTSYEPGARLRASLASFLTASLQSRLRDPQYTQKA